MADENKKANYAGIELWKLSVPELEKLLYSGSHLPDDGADEDFYDTSGSGMVYSNLLPDRDDI